MVFSGAFLEELNGCIANISHKPLTPMRFPPSESPLLRQGNAQHRRVPGTVRPPSSVRTPVIRGQAVSFPTSTDGGCGAVQVRSPNTADRLSVRPHLLDMLPSCLYCIAACHSNAATASASESGIWAQSAESGDTCRREPLAMLFLSWWYVERLVVVYLNVGQAESRAA